MCTKKPEEGREALQKGDGYKIDEEGGTWKGKILVSIHFLFSFEITPQPPLCVDTMEVAWEEQHNCFHIPKEVGLLVVHSSYSCSEVVVAGNMNNFEKLLYSVVRYM